MTTTSVWRASAASTAALPSLQHDLSADVLVIGAGITGLTLALLLAEQGRNVVVLEAAEIGSGTTGHSTGNLYATAAQGLDAVLSRWDAEITRQVLQIRAAAVDFVEGLCEEAPEMAGFRRCPMMLWALSAEQQSQVEKEFKALRGAGYFPEWLSQAPSRLPKAAGAVLALQGQAQFHPQAYVSYLCQRVIAAGGQVFENSAVVELDWKSKCATTATAKVRAQEIVLATHSPKEGLNKADSRAFFAHGIDG